MHGRAGHRVLESGWLLVIEIDELAILGFGLSTAPGFVVAPPAATAIQNVDDLAPPVRTGCGLPLGCIKHGGMEVLARPHKEREFSVTGIGASIGSGAGIAHGDVGDHTEVEVLRAIEIAGGTEGAGAEAGELKPFGDGEENGFHGDGHIFAEDADGFVRAVDDRLADRRNAVDDR